MFNTFNNQSIRKLVVAFGSLFDQIYVTRKNDTTGVEENIKVPITFASKEKFLRRLESNSSITDKVKTQINLPYLSFEMNTVAYDRNRKRNKLRVATGMDNSGLSYKSFAETPVDIEFRVYFYSRSMEEILQMAEQILPYFNPEFNIRINFNELYKDINVPINYRDFRILDDYEGALTNNRRILVGTMVFVASSYVFGEIKSGNPPTSTTLRIADLLTEDYIPPVTALTISSNLASVQYDHPMDTAVLLENLSWTEENVPNQTTTILVLNSDNEVIYSDSTEAGRQTLTTSMYDLLLEAIADDLNACGTTVTGSFTYTLLVQNGQLTDSRTFTFISFDGSSICDPVRSIYISEGLALLNYELPNNNATLRNSLVWTETNVLGATTAAKIFDTNDNLIYSKVVNAGVNGLLLSDVEDIAEAIANDLSTCGAVYSDLSSWTFEVENGALTDRVSFIVDYVDGIAICPITLTVNPALTSSTYRIPNSNALLQSRMTWSAPSYANPNTTIEVLDSDSNVIYTTTVSNTVTSVSSAQYTAIVSAIVTDLNACNTTVNGTFVYTLRITNGASIGTRTFTITSVINQSCLG
jgi:hypothetical protein